MIPRCFLTERSRLLWKTHAELPGRPVRLKRKKKKKKKFKKQGKRTRLGKVPGCLRHHLEIHYDKISDNLFPERLNYIVRGSLV